MHGCGQCDGADGNKGIALQDAHRARLKSLCVLEIQPESEQSAADQEDSRVNQARTHLQILANA
jgi:hypothetical protein